MITLFEVLCSPWFKNCQNCKTVKNARFNSVEICPEHQSYRKTEGKRRDELEVNDANIAAIINGRMDLYSCKRIYEHFYEKWMNDMPYGTAKGRDGDPVEWIFENLTSEYEHLLEEESA